jgi:hypothetical protein
MVEDWPLATMDYQTIKPSEVHPTNIFRERHEFIGQTVSINHAPEQKWYYLDRQMPEEVTLIKIWDNKEDVARCKAALQFEMRHDADCPQCVPTVHSSTRMDLKRKCRGRVLKLGAWYFMRTRDRRL